MTNSKKIGNMGESIAQNYLLQKGCTIIGVNYYSRFGEIDIIALSPTLKAPSIKARSESMNSAGAHKCNNQALSLLFIEVKYRKNERFSPAAAAITPTKQKRMLLTIAAYLQEFPSSLPLRIDLITIVGQAPYKIDWLKNIF